MRLVMGAEMQEVKSSHLESIGYNKENRQLIIKTRDRMLKSGEERKGDFIIYENVPDTEFNNMMASESKGAYLNKEIRGKYEHSTYKKWELPK